LGFGIEIDGEIQASFEVLINKLNEQGSLDTEKVPKPPKILDIRSIKGYVENLRLIIDTTDVIKNGSTHNSH